MPVPESAASALAAPALDPEELRALAPEIPTIALEVAPMETADYVPLVSHVETTAEDGAPAEQAASRPEGLSSPTKL